MPGTALEPLNPPVREKIPDKLKVLILDLLADSLFIYSYMNKYTPQMSVVVGRDILSVKEACKSYSRKYNMRFLSVRPFILDLTKLPEGSQIGSED